ncbi:MAG: hypothetical protein AUI09_01720 [Gemmatimonadetes bacterium 13_2_20CM_2_66_5]|nr:MAG: hypothetical protein AUI09_01720 [Gemmatimonadetes bacterium 13_2_20CM_2_66_5]
MICARSPVVDDPRTGYRVLLLGDPHPGDKPSQRAGDLIDHRGRMAGPGQRKACRVRKVADRHERGFGIANDVQATIYGRQLHERCAAAAAIGVHFLSARFKVAHRAAYPPPRSRAVGLAEQVEYLAHPERGRPTATQAPRPPANRPAKRERRPAGSREHRPKRTPPGSDDGSAETRDLQRERDPTSRPALRAFTNG